MGPIAVTFRDKNSLQEIQLWQNYPVVGPRSACSSKLSIVNQNQNQIAKAYLKAAERR